MKSIKNAKTSSRLLDPPSSISSNSADDWESRPTCESCNWQVTETQLFKGRNLCLSCIAAYFDAEGEENENS